MRVDEFEDLIDRLGADLSVWPHQVRSDAQLLLAKSAEARDILAADLDMRRALAPDPAVRAPVGLVDRIVLRARLHDARPVAPQTPRGFALASWLLAAWLHEASLAFRPTILLPLCFLVGLVIGLLPSGLPTNSAAIEPPSLFQGCCGDRSVN